MFAHTPICDESLETDLGRVLRQHITTYRADPSFSLDFTSFAWANVIGARAQDGTDARLSELTQSMVDLLAAPQMAGSQFKSLFRELWDEANKRAYPLSSLLRDEKQAYIDITRDYTLDCIDIGMVRVFEDRAVVDPVMQKFVDEMCMKLKTKGPRPRYQILRQVFDVYSEALVYQLIRERGGSRINVEKTPETSEPTPDFSVDLVTDDTDQQNKLSFFVEVKSLDVVHAPQRLPEMLDDGMDAQIELERQLFDGKNVAIAMTEVTPYRPYVGPADHGQGAARRVIRNDYDPRSTRRVIENLISKPMMSWQISKCRGYQTLESRQQSFTKFLRLGSTSVARPTV